MFNNLIISLFPKITDPEVKARWLKALRSGEYEQGKGALGQKVGTIKKTKQMCCLGVTAHVEGIGEWRCDNMYIVGDSSSVLTESNNHLGLNGDAYGVLRILMAKNDGASIEVLEDGVITELETAPRWSFDEIANFIEEYL